MLYKKGKTISKSKVRYYNKYNGFTILVNNMAFTSVAFMGSLKLGQHHFNITSYVEPYTTIYMLEDHVTKVMYMLHVDQLNIGGALQSFTYNTDIGTYEVVNERRFDNMTKGSLLYRDPTNTDVVRIKVVNDFTEHMSEHIVTENGTLNIELHIL